MNKFVISLCFVLVIFTSVSSQEINPDFDEKLANSLGADDYGMKNYILVILKTGQDTISNKNKRAGLFKGHMENIKRLVYEGKILVAGPFGENIQNYRGLFIMNVSTIDEAKILCESDPTVKAGIFNLVLIPWYGSAALGEYLLTSEKITKYKF